MELSKKALEILQALFADNSNLQLPVGIAKEVLEIREYVADKLKQTSKDV